MPRKFRPVILQYSVTACLNWSLHVTGTGDSPEAARADLLAKGGDKLSPTQYRRVTEALEEEE